MIAPSPSRSRLLANEPLRPPDALLALSHDGGVSAGVRGRDAHAPGDLHRRLSVVAPPAGPGDARGGSPPHEGPGEGDLSVVRVPARIPSQGHRRSLRHPSLRPLRDQRVRRLDDRPRRGDLHVDMEFGAVEVDAVEETDDWVRGALPDRLRERRDALHSISDRRCRDALEAPLSLRSAGRSS